MACFDPTNISCTVTDVVSGVVSTGAQVVAFASDPIGWLVQRLQEAVHALGALVIPYVLGALEPDYTAEWWVTSYAVSFGLSVLVMAFLMIATAARRVRGEIGPRALLESYFVAVPGFLIGASFGPLLGLVLTRLFVGLSDSLAMFFLDSSSSDFWKTFADRVSTPDASKLANSSVLALLMYLVLIPALLGVVFILVIQLATQYLVGALIPLGIVLMTNPDTRRLAKVGPLIWLAIVVSHVLLILVLGIAINATNALFLQAGDTSVADDPMRTFVNIAVPTVLMALVVFAPMRLLSLARFASPTNGGGMSSGGGFSPPPQAPQPGQTMLNAQQVAERHSRPGTSTSPSSAPAAVNTSTAKTSNAAATAGAEAGKTVAAGARAGGGAAAGAATGAAAGAGALGATGAAAGGGALATVGAGTMATGVGLPIGMSLLVMDSAIKTAHRASQAAEQAASQAADAGDERD